MPDLPRPDTARGSRSGLMIPVMVNLTATIFAVFHLSPGFEMSFVQPESSTSKPVPLSMSILSLSRSAFVIVYT